MRRLAYLLLIAVVLVGCKSKKHLVATQPIVDPAELVGPVAPSYLTSKLQLTIPSKDGSMTVGGTMKMKSRERVQISLLMPIIRSELARIEITPDEILVVDRMNRRYVRATKEELNTLLSDNVQFSQLEKILKNASLPGGKTELSGKELGIPSLEKAKVQLYEFSEQEFSLTPTELSARYTQVPLEVLMKMLKSLL